MAGLPSDDFAKAYALCRYPRGRMQWKSITQMENIINSQLGNINWRWRFDNSNSGAHFRQIARDVRCRWVEDHVVEFEDQGHEHDRQKQIQDTRFAAEKVQGDGTGQRRLEDGLYQDGNQTALVGATRGVVGDVKEEGNGDEKKNKIEEGEDEAELSKLQPEQQQGGLTTYDYSRPAAVRSGRKRGQGGKGNRQAKKHKSVDIQEDTTITAGATTINVSFL